MATLRGERRSRNDEAPRPIRQKRPRTEISDDEETILLRPEDYTVGWICALWVEMAAAKAMMDYIHSELPCKEDDSNAYILGSIAGHNIVITCLPAGHYGTNNAAIVASNLRRTFPCLDKGLMVGIGGGVPDSTDVRLGDVVVGLTVVQYDYGKAISNSRFKSCGIPVRPPQNLLTAVTKLRSGHDLSPSSVPALMADMVKRYPSMSEYVPPATLDQLFCSSYEHVGRASTCDRCDQTELLNRNRRQHNHPKIHYGTIASGNRVIKDGNMRANLGEELNCLCLEMEAAGLMDQFPCLVIRGICDYCDSHKNKQWQKYSAAVAAAYAKELLLSIPGTSKLRHSSAASPDPVIIPSKQRRVLLETLLDSLAFEQIEARLVTIKAAYSKTCNWFLSSPAYLSWLNSDEYLSHHGFLWIDGKPGAGKSTLIKFVYIHTLSSLNTTADSTVLSFFFNARGDELEQSVIGLYRSLLFQILNKFPDLQDALDDGNHRSNIYRRGINWDVATLQMLFARAVARLGQRCVTCFIDALDECNEVEVRDMVEYFDRLGSVASQSRANNIRICFSSRHYPYIEINNGLRLTLESQLGHSQDLRNYVENKLRTGPGKAKQDITESILAKASGVFMWVVLVVDILNMEFQRGRIFAVQRRLNELPSKLGELFQEILTRDTKDMDDLLLCIQWILYSKRRLSCQEFYFGMVSGLDATPENLSAWDSERITHEDMERFVLSSSKGLAELTKSKNQTVQFIHESVRDFLIKDNGIRQLWPEAKKDFESFSHDRLKQCCSVYMSVDVSEIVSTNIELPPASSDQAARQRKEVSKKFPFLKYACKYIFYHANIAARTLPQISFLKSFSTPKWVNLYNIFQAFGIYRYTADASLVYILASCNCAELIKTAIRSRFRTNGGGGRYRYPLMAALNRGYLDVAKLLLTLGDVDDSGVFLNQKALTWVIPHGDETLVSLLIDGNVNIDAEDGSGRTPLSYAAEAENEISLKLYLASGRVDINSQDKKFFTPLHYAVTSQRISNVKRILEVEDVYVDHRDDQGQTPFWHAIDIEDEGIATLLLETKKVDVNAVDMHRHAPLTSAVLNNSYSMVKFLLGIKEVDLNSRCDNGRTPLMNAVRAGNEDVVKLLLTRPDIDIQARDKINFTALRYAKHFGESESIVKILREAAADDSESEY